MSQEKILNRLGKYKVNVTGNLGKPDKKGANINVGFKISIPSEIAEIWGFNDEVARTRELFKYSLSGKDIDLIVHLYAAKIGGNIVLIASKDPHPDDILG